MFPITLMLYNDTNKISKLFSHKKIKLLDSASIDNQLKHFPFIAIVCRKRAVQEMRKIYDKALKVIYIIVYRALSVAWNGIYHRHITILATVIYREAFYSK